MAIGREKGDCSDNEVALDRSNTLPLLFQRLFIFVFMKYFFCHVSNSTGTCLLKFMNFHTSHWYILFFVKSYLMSLMQ